MRIPCLAAMLLFAAVTCITAQDFDLATFRRCAGIAEQTFCTDTDSVRKALDAALSCNSRSDAFLIANSCARDSRTGLHCGAVHAYVRDISAILYNTCASTIGGANCTSECWTSLRDIRETLGCCINAIVNSTDSVYSFALPAFTYSLWSGCDVDPPNSTCSGALDFTPPVPQPPSCTAAHDMACSQSSLDATTGLINTQRTCKSLLPYQMDFCSRRDGDYCINNIQTDINVFATSIQMDCAPSLVTQACTSGCKSLLQSFVDQRGCCVNTIFNSTYAAVTGLNFTAPVLANNALFQICEVEPPPLTCGSLPFRVPSFTLLIPLIIATMFGRKMM